MSSHSSSDDIIDITAKDGRRFRLLRSAKAVSVMDTTIVSSLSKFQRGARCQHLMSRPRDNASDVIISATTTRNVKSFTKQFVVVI